MLAQLLDNRLFLILISFITIGGYTPINHMLKHGRVVKCFLDDRIPLIRGFIYPYLFFYMPWMVFFYFSLLWQPLQLAQQVTLATILACGIGYFFFIFFPTYVIAEVPQGKGIANMLLRHVHNMDKKFNACPSMHVYMVTLFTVFSAIMYPRFISLFLVMGTAIIVSTVFTKRHYVYDIFGGLAVGIFAVLTSLFLI